MNTGSASTPPGNYLDQYYNGELSYAQADLVTLAEGDAPQNVNAALQAGGAIAGTVTAASDDGELGEIEVCARISGESYFEKCAKTAANGSYEIIALRTGEYYVEFFSADGSDASYMRQYYDGQYEYGDAEPVSVTLGVTTPGIDAVMQEAAKITGTVTGAGAPLHNASVCIYAGSSEYASRCVQTDENGEYALIGLDAGSYKVGFTAPYGQNFVAQYYNETVAGAPSLAAATPVSVTIGDPASGIDAALQEGGLIEGTIEGDGAGLAYAEACAYPVGSDSYTACGYTDTNGDYTIPSLASVSYEVRFTPPYGANYLAQWYEDKANRSEAAQVAVTAGGDPVGGIDATLHEGGRIEGTVTDAAGDPVEGVSACARKIASGYYSSTCDSTDGDGKYVIVGLASGSYRVEFQPPYSSSYLRQYHDGVYSEEEATPVAVTAGGDPVSEIDAVMREGGRIEGTVTDADTHAGLEYASVCAYEASGYYGSRCVYTDSDGTYAFTGLTPGRYKIRFESPEGGGYVGQYYEGAATFATAEPIEIEAEGLQDHVDAALHPGGGIAGAVEDEGGDPIEDVEACARRAATGAMVECAYTEADGAYEISGLPDDDYKVEFQPPYEGNYLGQYYADAAGFGAAATVSVSGGGTTSPVNAVLHPGTEIAGAVSDASLAPVEEAEVCAYEVGGEETERCTETGSDGAYSIDGLRSGAYKVGFQPPYGSSYLSQYYAGKARYSEATPVTVVAGEPGASGIDAVLELGGSISGTVTDEVTLLPIADADVCAYADGDEESFRCTDTNSSGHYVLGSLPEGSYAVRFTTSTSQGYMGEYYDDAPTEDDATLVAVTSEQDSPGIDAELAQGGRITGRVTDAATPGQGVIGAYVCAYTVGNGLYAGCASADSDGDYSLGGLAAGQYKVSFSAGGYVGEYYDDERFYADATPVTVTAGSPRLGVDAALQAGGRIKGHVTDASSEPAPGVQVCAMQGSFTYSCMSTSAAGNYAIAGLPTGSYQVRFEAGSTCYGPEGCEYPNYAPQYWDGKPSAEEAEAVAVEAGVTKDGIDATMQTGASIEGHVTLAGGSEPASSARVCAYLGTDEEEPEDCVTANLAGGYRLQGLAAGSYKLSFQGQDGANLVPEYYDDAATLAGAEAIELGPGDAEEGVDAALQPGGLIAGHVTAAAGGADLEAIEVCAYEAGLEEALRCTETDFEGRYVLDELGAGDYQVRFSAGWICGYQTCDRPDYAPQFFEGAESRAEATAVEVEAGETTPGIDAAMLAGGSISGTVTEAVGGAPVAGAWVCAYYEGETETEECTETGPDGTYAISPLAAGPHKVSFEPGVLCGPESCTEQDYVTQYWHDKATLAAADTVAVTEEGTPGIDAAMAAPAVPKPVNTAKPQIGGSPAVGQTLSCSHGSWDNSPTEYAYQWLRDGGQIATATASDYEVQEADAGHYLACRVTASNGGGSASATSDAVSIPPKPANTAPPVVSGTPGVGEELSCDHGAWTGSPTYAYQWLRDGGEIGDATATTHVVQAADAGHDLACRVTASNGSGATVATSATVHVPAAPVNTALPSVSGDPEVGQELSCDHGAWDHSPTAYAYEWLLGATPIEGEDGDSYTVRAGDRGQNVFCRVTASNEDGSATATSLAFPIPAPPGAPANTAKPQISGTPAVGQTLSCSNGSWDNAPASFAYAWLRDGSAISGQSDQTYAVQAADAGSELACTVTATNGEGSASATSDPVEVPAKPVNTVAPQINGTVAVDEILACSHGSWDNSPTEYAYQWLRDGGEIADATASDYEVQSADAGHALACRVTASNAGGSASRTSDPVSVPVPIPANTAKPQISGTPALGQTLSCSNGSWNNAPASFAYAWLRDGGQIGGAIANAYVVQGADQGHALACRVTASNAGGSAEATSGSVQVPAAQDAGTPVNGGGGGAAIPTPTPPAPTSTPQPKPKHKHKKHKHKKKHKKKRHKCKKGFKAKRKKVRGKVKFKCVKVKKKGKRKHR